MDPLAPTAPASRPGRLPGTLDPHAGLVLGTRWALLALCVTLQVGGDQGGDHPIQLVALLVVGLVITVVERIRTNGYVAVAEAACVALVIAAVVPLQVALLPCLLAPALAAGLRGGTRAAVLATGLATVVLLGAPLVVDIEGDLSSYLSSTSLWLALAVATGLLGAWIRRIEVSAAEGSRTYDEVNKLLVQLRDAARHLPGSLDEVTIAQTLLQSLRETTRFSRGGVSAVSEGERLMPLARLGAAAVDVSVEIEVDDATPWNTAWRTRSPAVASTSLDGGPHAFSVVLPIMVGHDLIALAGLERPEAPFSPDEIDRCATIAEQAGPGLDTAGLFSEVRNIATAEERRRLAREIHDGIAQEIASLGYVVDDLMSRPASEPTRPADLRNLRRELTRVVTELRLSIFDLRSEVRPDTGIGEALSAYVRSVGAGSAFTVHLVLDEPRGRLRVEVEAELLRIAQEAITNARKHAGASNLWVTCRVDPPHAVLRVEDDGSGLGPRRADSYGLDIMRERAARIGGAVHVGDRPGGGTLVEVIIGRPRRGTRQASTADHRNEQEGVDRVHDGAPR